MVLANASKSADEDSHEPGCQCCCCCCCWAAAACLPDLRLFRGQPVAVSLPGQAASTTPPDDDVDRLYNSNTQPLNRPGPQPGRPKTPIYRALAEQDRHVPVRILRHYGAQSLDAQREVVQLRLPAPPAPEEHSGVR
eukprot:360002-Chlamydomonas_euryale.AAC.1